MWLEAEGEGFEPSVQGLPTQRFSRPPRSTTPAPLRGAPRDAGEKGSRRPAGAARRRGRRGGGGGGGGGGGAGRGRGGGGAAAGGAAPARGGEGGRLGRRARGAARAPRS